MGAIEWKLDEIILRDRVMEIDQRNYSRSKNLPTKRGNDDPG